MHKFLLFPLQFECGAATPGLTCDSGNGGGRLDLEKAAGRARDVSEMKMLVSAARLPPVSRVSPGCLSGVTSEKKR